MGNPPWGADLAEIREYLEGGAFDLARGQYDSYELFIELGRRLLREGGSFGFIVPDSITLPEHEPLRRMLLDQTTLDAAGAGRRRHLPLGLPRRLLPLLRQPAPAARAAYPRGNLAERCTESNWKKTRLFEPVKAVAAIVGDIGHDRVQSDFARNPRAEFDVLAADEDRVIGGLVDARALVWPDITTTGRGVELGKRGEILQCPYCYRWDTVPTQEQGSPPRTKKCAHCGRQFPLDVAANRAAIVGDREKGDGWRPFLIGKSINRYYVSHRLWIDASVDGINYKDGEFYEGKRLLVRKTGVGVMATIDDSGALY